MNTTEEHNEMRGGYNPIPNTKQGGKKKKIIVDKGEPGSTVKGVEDSLKVRPESGTKETNEPKPNETNDEEESKGDYYYKSAGYNRKEKGDSRKTEPNDLKEAKDDRQVNF